MDSDQQFPLKPALRRKDSVRTTVTALSFKENTDSVFVQDHTEIPDLPQSNLPASLHPRISNISSSFVSLRKSRASSRNSLIIPVNNLDNKQNGDSTRNSSVSSTSTAQNRHPLVQYLWLYRDAIMSSPLFKTSIFFLADDRVKIMAWYFLMVFMHVIVTTIFICSIWLVMPGMWVYNFMQLFVMIACTIAHVSACALSQIIRVSITAGDLTKGRITFPQLSDFWSRGPKSPAYKVITTTRWAEVGAIFILITSTVFFSWVEVQTKIDTGDCLPPAYINASLPIGIDVPNYLQGDIDYAAVYNFGLPLADGLIGGWSGWPIANPMNSFQISGDGPVYVIQVLCDNGVSHPELNYGIFTHISGRIISEDAESFMMQITIAFPSMSVYDDIFDVYSNYTVVQGCSVVVSVGHGTITYHFVADQWAMVTNGQMVDIVSPKQEFYTQRPSSIAQFSSQARAVFSKYKDAYNTLPILKAVIFQSFMNESYAPSQGGLFCNILSEGTWPDGYYHTESTYRGVATALTVIKPGIGAAANFALMQYSSLSSPVKCNYFGFQGSGMLFIPQIAIYLSASASVVACLMKAFEILWWFMAQIRIEFHALKRARRSLRHPMRFAMDIAEMLVMGMEAGKNGDDICDITLKKAIEELGAPKVVYGEDLVTREMENGHLRIGEYGKVKSILKDKDYGTCRKSLHPEWDEFVWK
ncbi:hypothetical protein HK100_009921 [Physocladia obscura]|uniref:Uncharacterized protein n=1 Tax=Physocladia obscura TaxID=109957 RepID=A0AAD5XHS7_9FUNG|nr:hypothetical protein HK100_009921 [Physocladia obscura]